MEKLTKYEEFMDWIHWHTDEYFKLWECVKYYGLGLDEWRSLTFSYWFSKSQDKQDTNSKNAKAVKKTVT